MEKLVREAQELFHIHLTGRQVMALVTYERELLDWHQTFPRFAFVRHGVGRKPAAPPRGRWNRRRFPGTSTQNFISIHAGDVDRVGWQKSHVLRTRHTHA